MSDRASSRSPDDLHAELADRWTRSLAEYAHVHPTDPQPFLTQTYRSAADQATDFAVGRTTGTPGKVVTHAKSGQSLHNYYPALAFDIGFKDAHGALDWSVSHFRNFAAIAKGNGLAWGGDWTHSTDLPHFEPPHYTWEMASLGQQPTFPNIA